MFEYYLLYICLHGKHSTVIKHELTLQAVIADLHIDYFSSLLDYSLYSFAVSALFNHFMEWPLFRNQVSRCSKFHHLSII